MSQPEEQASSAPAPAERAGGGGGSTPVRKERRGMRQFLREVRAELRKVAWPSRKEVVSYTVVVLIAVILLTTLVFFLDLAFGEFVFWMFG